MERLKQLREAKGLTQLRLAMELNVSQETISGYEIGKAVPPAEMLVKLADALDVLGPHQGVDDLAAAAGTIGYEVLTSLGPRYTRRYSAGARG